MYVCKPSTALFMFTTIYCLFSVNSLVFCRWMMGILCGFHFLVSSLSFKSEMFSCFHITSLYLSPNNSLSFVSSLSMCLEYYAISILKYVIMSSFICFYISLTILYSSILTVPISDLKKFLWKLEVIVSYGGKTCA